LPLHDSQLILADNEKELREKLILFVTYDLVKELISYGEYVKILKAVSFGEGMKRIFSNALSHDENGKRPPLSR
jgi:hypothetical protein